MLVPLHSDPFHITRLSLHAPWIWLSMDIVDIHLQSCRIIEFGVGLYIENFHYNIVPTTML